MNWIINSTLLCCFGLLSTAAATILPTPGGSLKIDEITLSIQCFKAPDWKLVSQESKAFQMQKKSGNEQNFHLEANITIPGLPKGSLQETVKQKSADQWNYHAVICFTEAAEFAQIALGISLPVETFQKRELSIDGRKLKLPAKFSPKNDSCIFKGRVNDLILPTRNGKLIFRGNFDILLQDNRSYRGNTYSLRFFFTPSRGKITRSSLELSITYSPYHSIPINLSTVANMGFADEKAEDRQGGWTDQGPTNDLHMIPVGKHRWGGIEFEIIDPELNNGKSCLMLAGPTRDYFPRQAAVSLPKPLRGNYLYLLHALAWPVEQRQIGSIIITYADGDKGEIPIIGGHDVGNWWEAASRHNGDVVWTGENQSSFVGLYRSVFPVKKKPLKRIEFQSNGRSVWGIAAASLSNDLAPQQLQPPVYITAGKNWRPIVYHKDFEKGSVLDFSNRLDAPAGKYGPIVVKGNKLVFRDRPDVTVRFYGTNLCYSSQYLTKEWAERLADRLAAQGYNAVRFHHHDDDLALHQNGRSTELNPVMLDRLDYLMACLKKRGIYYTTDLYVSRKIEQGEIPEFPDHTFTNRTFKSMVFVLDSAMNNWKSFSQNWLCHVNPYTRVALKDDPALISLSMINEDNIASCWNSSPESTRLYQRRFEQWKKENGIRDSSADLADVYFSQFLTEVYDRGYQEMKQFVRGLGVKAILSDQNMLHQELLAVMRNQYDYVDNHFYWAHPGFPEGRWRLPSTATTQSALSAEARCPANIAPTRLLDKPMMITEFDFAKPNPFRAEGAILTGAYGALQDWDALFQFAYAHNRTRIMRSHDVAGHFDTSTDPVKALAQRIGVRLFLDREVKPAPISFAAVLTSGKGMNFTREYSREINRLALIARVGTLIAPAGKLAGLPDDTAGLLNLGCNFPSETGSRPVFPAATSEKKLLTTMTAAGILKPEWYDPEHGIFRASNGQITLDSRRQTFQVTTPSCEVLILPAETRGSAHFLKASNRIGRAVFAVMSLDGKPLKDSDRLALFHLTDTLPSRVKFRNSRMIQMDQWGTTPYLAARGEAEIELATTGRNYTLYAVNTAGKRVLKVPVKYTPDHSLSFPVQVFSKAGPVFVYELIRQ